MTNKGFIMLKIQSTLTLGVLALLASAVSAQAQNNYTELLWHNPATGLYSGWLADYTGHVTGTQPLGFTCDGPGPGCSEAWKVVGTDTGKVLWYNATSGQIVIWFVNNSGTLLRSQTISWGCAISTGCAQIWKIVGFDVLNNYGNPTILWHNATTGVLGVWVLDANGAVTATPSISVQCGVTPVCSQVWKVVGTGDFNHDGNIDVLWQNATTGVLGAWLLSGTTVIGFQNLSQSCGTATGCAQSWHVIGVGDMNGDGNVDVLWYNPTTGEARAWLRDGAGTVTGMQSLSWLCPAANGCSQTWIPLGLIPPTKF